VESSESIISRGSAAIGVDKRNGEFQLQRCFVDQATIELTVSAGSTYDANSLSDELRVDLERDIEGISVSEKKVNSETLDVGTIIVAALGTQFALELARTLHAYLLRNSDAEVSIGPDGKVTGKNLSLEAIQELVRVALAKGSKSK
jgi:hypothetical protein